jgi:pimeloyl-ACP methyl ester carboxylesterase
VGADPYDDLVAYLRARDDAEPGVAPAMRSQILRGPTDAPVVVLLHGLTASPPAWRDIAEALHAHGATVVIPRLLLHGHADRMTTALRDLGADALVEETALLLARVAALGVPVTVVGHSLGATVAIDAAARLPKVARIVAIAPFLGIAGFPQELHQLLAAVLGRWRRRFVWWDPRVRERLLPEHGYPRYPLGALLAGLEIADHLRASADQAPPAAAIDIVLNDRETGVNNRTALRLVRAWRSAGASVAMHRVRGLGWSHDIIEPSRQPARAVLETLVAIIEGEHLSTDREHMV